MRNSRSPFLPLLKSNNPGLSFYTNFDLTRKTSMRMKCESAAFADVKTADALETLLSISNSEGFPAFILGGGQNTLFASSHFEGLVFQLSGEFNRISKVDSQTIRAGAGVQLPKLLRFAKDQGLMGLEFLTMVPGTVGGSLAGNAGAGNWGICDFAERVFLITRDGFVACVNRNEFRYSYRKSELKDAIVLFADFRLEPRNEEEAERRRIEYTEKKKNQPYNKPSSGCIFKNPKSLRSGKAVSAGKLIDEAGLKGYRIGSAMISETHANFMINEGESCGEDFLALINLVRDIIRERTGIDLQVEVQIVGGPLNTVRLG